MDDNGYSITNGWVWITFSVITLTIGFIILTKLKLNIIVVTDFVLNMNQTEFCFVIISAGKLLPRSYFFHFEKKWKSNFRSLLSIKGIDINFWILLNETKFGIWLQFSDWFGTLRNSIRCGISWGEKRNNYSLNLV